jgi:MFS family permease
MVLIIFSLLRNTGQWPIYMFGMSMDPQDYQCRTSKDDDFKYCPNEFICEQRKNGASIEFEPMSQTNYFMENLFVSYDLMCTSPTSYNSIGSFYFIGYGIGAIFFFLPDAIGRKNVMSLFMIFLMFGLYISAFASDYHYMKLGFFLIGFFHLKISLSYTYAAELVPESSKQIVLTLISAYDACSLLIACCIMKYYKPSEHLVMQLHFGLGLIALILFSLVIPESPKWLFMKFGTNCQEAINILNYIAWFNGSELRVPEDAIFDVLGQAIEEDVSKLQT